MSPHRDALLLARESLTPDARPDDPGAVLALVQAALDSGDPAMLDDAYAALRRAMRRLLAHPECVDAPSPEPGDRGAGRPVVLTRRRLTHRRGDPLPP